MGYAVCIGYNSAMASIDTVYLYIAWVGRFPAWLPIVLEGATAVVYGAGKCPPSTEPGPGP